MTRTTIFLVGSIVALLALSCPAGEKDWAAQREAMVREQIERRGVAEPNVLAAMRRVPRHRFVPMLWQLAAYGDQALPIEEGQTISQPYIVALMSAAPKLTRGEKVLEIGTGSGYQAAILAEMGCRVYTIEIVPVLAESAAKRLRELGYSAVQTRAGDGYLGWPEQAPFDAILVTCAPEQIPQPLVDQLREGGRICIPVGPEGQTQTLVLARKRGGRMEREELLPVLFVPLVRDKSPPTASTAGSSGRTREATGR